MKYLLFILLAFLLCSCGGDDDICESGEGTPRMKVAFKNAATGKVVLVDSIYVTVDYGSGNIVDLGKTANSEFRLIPLRVDDAPYTDVYFKTRLNGNESKVRINYTTTSTYVSPGCGIKKTYENLNPELVVSEPVQQVELSQNFIENEDKTNIYLLF